MHITHVALWAHDPDLLKVFYERYFGARASGPKYVNAAKGFQSWFLDFETGARLEVMGRLDIVPRPPGGELRGFAHLAIAVGSELAVDALTRRLIDDGVRCVDGPRRTGDGYYESVILDPEGNRVEITV